jgi:hypothetical protein
MALAGLHMEKRVALIGVVSFVLLIAGGALCQDAIKSLPDSPSVQVPPSMRFDDVLEEARSPVAFLTSGADGEITRAIRQSEFIAPKKAFSYRQPNAIFSKYLSPTSRKRPSSEPASATLMGRATQAAVRIFVTQDESGRARVNSSYFLRTLTSVAADTAARPYWRRSLTDPVSDFGSTMGNDAGMNVLHEFAPNLQQVMKSHAPRFVSKIEARIGQR